MWKQKAEQHWPLLKLSTEPHGLCLLWVFSFCLLHKRGKRWWKLYFISICKINPRKVPPGSKRLECKCYCMSKLFVLFNSSFQRKPLRASQSLYVSLPLLIFKLQTQKAGDFSLAQKSVWFNLVNAHPVAFSYIYMCICKLYTHIYSRYTCTVCIVTYI